MNINRRIALRASGLVALLVTVTVASSRMHAQEPGSPEDTGMCGGVTITLPFTDVMGNPFFCQIAAAYFSGLTNGTSATTYTPSANLTREQMAAFVTPMATSTIKACGVEAAVPRSGSGRRPRPCRSRLRLQWEALLKGSSPMAPTCG